MEVRVTPKKKPSKKKHQKVRRPKQLNMVQVQLTQGQDPDEKTQLIRWTEWPIGGMVGAGSPWSHTPSSPHWWPWGSFASSFFSWTHSLALVHSGPSTPRSPHQQPWGSISHSPKRLALIFLQCNLRGLYPTQIFLLCLCGAVLKNKGITNTLAMPIDKMLYVYLTVFTL